MRTRKNQRAYAKYLSEHPPDVCDFCNFDNVSERVLTEHDQFWTVISLAGYDAWDSSRVEESLMVVPKRHVSSMTEFSDSEKIEYVGIIGAAEEAGYSLYARPVDGHTRTVAHQHTHLLKLEKGWLKTIVYLRKPHILWFR